MLSNVDSQKMIFSIKVAFLGAAIGFSFMVCYYLTRIPDHLQSAFLRSQYIPSRLDGLGALLIYGSTTLSGLLLHLYLSIGYMKNLSVRVFQNPRGCYQVWVML